MGEPGGRAETSPPCPGLLPTAARLVCPSPRPGLDDAAGPRAQDPGPGPGCGRGGEETFPMNTVPRCS